MLKRKRMYKGLFASAALFGVLVFTASGSFCAMTAGELVISTSVIGSGGGSGTTDSYALQGVCGQPASAGTSETSQYSMNSGYIFTLTGVTIESTGAPTMEWVKMNGLMFKSGNVISANSTVRVKLMDEHGVATIEMTVDPDDLFPTKVLFDLVLDGSTTFEGQWQGSVSIQTPGTHTLRFYAKDSEGHGKYYDYLGRVMGGAVQVIGSTYNYPNPFSPMSGGATTIQYTLSSDATIMIIIYDITGHEVKRMKFGGGSAGGRGGTNQASWNGKTLGGEVAGNGIYLYKIISGNNVIGSGKLVVFDQ